MNCEKNFFVASHRNSLKHDKLLKPQNQSTLALYEAPTEGSWAYQVTRAFMQADIPLYKIHQQSIKELFTSMNKPLPSVSKCRSAVELMCQNILNNIKEKITTKRSSSL